MYEPIRTTSSSGAASSRIERGAAAGAEAGAEAVDAEAAEAAADAEATFDAAAFEAGLADEDIGREEAGCGWEAEATKSGSNRLTQVRAVD